LDTGGRELPAVILLDWTMPVMRAKITISLVHDTIGPFFLGLIRYLIDSSNPVREGLAWSVTSCAKRHRYRSAEFLRVAFNRPPFLERTAEVISYANGCFERFAGNHIQTPGCRDEFS
jgi:hypothetical protein